jgi:hypothetical protein
MTFSELIEASTFCKTRQELQEAASYITYLFNRNVGSIVRQIETILIERVLECAWRV